MHQRPVSKLDRRRFLAISLTAAAAATLTGLPFAASAAPAGGNKTKIGIIGAGKVGTALGSVWVRAGHEVMFSSRTIADDRALAAKLGAGAHAGTPREAAAFGDVVMVSVPYHALPQVGEDLADLLAGKVVIDTCNPFVSRDGDIATWAREKGAGLASAELLPGARVVAGNSLLRLAVETQLHETRKRHGPVAPYLVLDVLAESQLTLFKHAVGCRLPAFSRNGHIG